MPANLTLSGSVNVTGAAPDPNTTKDVHLATTTQAQGSNYVVTVNGVTDVSSNAIADNSTISFTSWKIASGWITRDFYYHVAGGTVDDLILAPNFPVSPDALDFVRTVSIGSDLQLANYGARRVGTPGNVADIPLLGGSMVATFVNPDAASGNKWIR